MWAFPGNPDARKCIDARLLLFQLKPGSTANIEKTELVQNECHEQDTPSTLMNRWKIVQKIGSGSFGRVFKAKDMVTNKFVAIKIARIQQNKGKITSGSDQEEDSSGQLENEYIVLRHLKTFSSKINVPKVYFFSKKTDYPSTVFHGHSVLVQQLVSYSFGKKSTFLLNSCDSIHR
uniref:Protein kinase domain-containing protein n=1 Tax=Guillardia theta TaxID=55529 RepID=A0A7S4K656_GUITH|mmetsp:Transcript_21247/g.70499  ORF Transcript_21247/g.70499 Transcript_21247/m.70499 type:complete len:176 (+) Transcript_21247:141-668(+)